MTFSLKISSLENKKQKSGGGNEGKGQARNFWLCQKTNKHKETPGSENLGDSATYDLAQATLKRLHQLPYFVEVQAYTRAVFNAQPGSLRGYLLFGDVPLQVHCWFLHHYTKRE